MSGKLGFLSGVFGLGLVMFEWFKGWLLGISKQVLLMPVWLAAPMTILVGALDSSLFSLPEVNDYITIYRVAHSPNEVWYFPLFPAIGSVIGCMILYTIAQRGGQFVMRRFDSAHLEMVRKLYLRWGVFALAVPALLPPPMPFKIFVATAGALQFPRRRFLVTILIARSVRYYTEGFLAVFYGQRVLAFMKDNGLIVISAVTGVLVIALVIYLLSSKGRAAVRSGKKAR